MPVDSQHPQYSQYQPVWQQIDNICDGENLRQYLVKMNEHDTSKENKERNDKYYERAIFYAVAGWTVSGMVGTMFTKWPNLNVPPELDYLKTNCDGAGQSIYQQSQTVSYSVVKNSRAGLAVSFPAREQRSLSQAEVESGLFIPTIHEYKPKQIINWDTKTVGSKTFLSLVCTAETVSVEQDFEHVQTETIRERRIDDDGLYFERVWKLETSEKSANEWVPGDLIYPTDGKGNPLLEIPFIFVGSVSNTPAVNKPLMREITRINIGHYRNSADYEESVFFCGQAQSWMSGVDEQHLKMMKENGMYVGAPTMLAVPSGEQFGFAVAPENTAVSAAMKAKIEMMIGLGARFLQPGTAVKTATQAAGDLAMQHSVLSLVANNISEAYTQCIKWCALFLNLEYDPEMAYTIAQDFVKPNADAGMIQQIVASWMSGALPASDMWEWLRKNEIINPEKSNEQIAEEIGQSSPVPDLDDEVVVE